MLNQQYFIYLQIYDEIIDVKQNMYNNCTNSSKNNLLGEKTVIKRILNFSRDAIYVI